MQMLIYHFVAKLSLFLKHPDRFSWFYLWKALQRMKTGLIKWRTFSFRLPEWSTGRRKCLRPLEWSLGRWNSLPAAARFICRKINPDIKLLRFYASQIMLLLPCNMKYILNVPPLTAKDEYICPLMGPVRRLAIALSTDKMIKNALDVLEDRHNLLQKCY